MILRTEFQRQAIATHVVQRLAGPARAILGSQGSLLDKARDLKVAHLETDLEKIGIAARELISLVEHVAESARNPPAVIDVEAEASLRHDLRTPLNAIIGYAEMILEDMLDEQPGGLKEDIGFILAAATELLRDVDVMADLSRYGAVESLLERDKSGPELAALERLVFKEKQGGRAFQEGKILVVDDVAGNRDVLSRRLRREGHQVVTAESGLAALSRLAEEDFDLVILDILMPDMNGIEVLSRLKEEPRWWHIPVIMVSGLKEINAVAKCIEAGADDYLTKPFDPVLMRARINSGLEKKRSADREHLYLRQIETEKRRADSLLHAMLPSQIVDRLQAGEELIADRFEKVSILFADIVGFSPIAARLPPSDLVRRLDHMFGKFDLLAQEHRVEKIKTIGDAYMAACGVPEPASDHADRILALGRSMLKCLQDLPEGSEGFHIRIGIHSGPVVAGLIGRHRFVYDIWGETVNIASRLESQGVADRMQISEATRRALHGSWMFEPRRSVELRGIGTIDA
jgi:class 3 adenylate cyclase/CheY-like chemotaxis protein